MPRRRAWTKLVYAFGLLLFFNLIGIPGVVALPVLLTLDDLR